MVNRKSFINQVGKELGKHASDYGYTFPWCVIWGTQQLRKAGVPIDEFTSCNQIKKALAAKVNKSFDTIEVGDILLLDWRTPEDGPDHFALCIGRTGDYIDTIEGNAGDEEKVALGHYKLGSDVLDCVIDMSEYFEDGKDNAEPDCGEIVQQIKKKLKEIDTLVKELEMANFHW